MFASLDLEQKELKKLWIEFGKIDTDNGGTNHESLVRFAFDLFDRDHSGAIETAEMEAMLREVYGEHFADSPAAALTLKRVKELSSSSDAGPTNETTLLALAKNGVQVGPDGRIYALSFEAFREFCRQHAGMLFPAFTLQKRVRSKIVSEAFWKGCADRRNGVRPGRNKGKGGKRSSRKAIQLEHLSTMMNLDEKSATGTTTDNTPAPNGSATGTANTTAQGNGCAQTPTKALPSPSPAPGDEIKAPSEARKRGSGGNDDSNNSSGSSSKTPATAGKTDDAAGCDTPDGAGEKEEGQARRGGDGGHEKGTGDGGTPRKRRSGSRGVVAVEGDEGSWGGSENKTPRFSMQAPQASREGTTTHRVSGTPSHGGGASRPATLRQGAPTNGPPTGTSATDNAVKTPQPRQTYPLPVDAGGRGTSAWARGGGEEPMIGGGGMPPGLAGGVGIEESAPGRRQKKESRVDSPLAAAARAAAVYELPALRETAATKQRSHHARDLVAGSRERGGRPASAGGSHSPNARQRRRETGQAAAAARAVAGVAACGGHKAESPSTTPHANANNVVRDTHEHHHSPRAFHDHRTVPENNRATHS
ncbi:conserved unknown protein [Ectocarpus siliculosus]|uniref:EF-hand domain-containing protein n=1 Tax=Ectocarpus siliculosus TaxID=2880 RepID=D7FLL2_ECTSI|nr:conserved unknown protein [Ectocarpus siliculosus]|eukprot:CBJ25828.1 conserved unknown protein [Ectocarpus siliculosus]